MKKIGIIGAMELEVDTLKKDMVMEKKISKAGMEFCEGTLKGTKVVVVKSGIGKSMPLYVYRSCLICSR